MGKVAPLLARLLPIVLLHSFLAQAIYDRQTVDVRFNEIIYKHMLKQPIDFDDMKHVDPIFCKSLEVTHSRSLS